MKTNKTNKTFKIPLRVDAIAYAYIQAKNLNEACNKAMNPSILSEEDIILSNDTIPIIDDQHLEKLYPKEYTQMQENEKPYWEKLGWKQEGDTYTKNNAKIINTFDDVGWGFKGTVWIGNTGKSGFNTLESAINYAEEHINQNL